MEGFDSITEKGGHKPDRFNNLKVRIFKLRQNKLFKIFLKVLLILAISTVIAGVGLFLFKNAACSAQVRYGIGEIDPRFELSRDKVIDLATEAGVKWNEALGKEMFVYDEKAALKINFVYDQRQSERDAMEKKINDLNLSYGSLTELKSKINGLLTAYEAKLAAYNAEVRDWNARGGTSRTAFYSLESRRLELKTEAEYINQLISTFNNSQQDYNLTVTDFNKLVSEKIGQTEEEGIFYTNSGKPYIEIFVNDGEGELRLLFMHELGHSKTLTHATDGESVMSGQMSQSQIDTLKITDTDLELLKTCRLSEVRL